MNLLLDKYQRPTAIRIPKVMKQELDRVADSLGKARSVVIREAIRQYLSRMLELEGGP